MPPRPLEVAITGISLKTISWFVTAMGRQSVGTERIRHTLGRQITGTKQICHSLGRQNAGHTKRGTGMQVLVFVHVTMPMSNNSGLHSVVLWLLNFDDFVCCREVCT